jgi:hypothetical protein
MFYLHKYSHSFNDFNDIVIQLFQKMSVMTVATLHHICTPLWVFVPLGLLIPPTGCNFIHSHLRLCGLGLGLVTLVCSYIDKHATTVSVYFDISDYL